MVFYQNNEWHLSTYKVVYTDDGEQLENTVGQEGKDWWTELAKKHNEIDILEFIEIEHSEEKMTRLEEINQLNLPDGFSAVISNYVIDNKFPEGFSHPLRQLQTKKESEELRMEQTMATMELGGAMQMLNIQNEVSQAEMLMEIGMLLEQLQGGN